MGRLSAVIYYIVHFPQLSLSRSKSIPSSVESTIIMILGSILQVEIL